MKSSIQSAGLLPLAMIVAAVVAFQLAAPALRAEEAKYTGDGKYQDNGPRAVINKHVLDLGPIDLKANKKYEFDLTGLPDAEFVAGLVLDMPFIIGQVEPPAWFKDVKVRMVLIDVTTKKTVFEIDQDLMKYTSTNASPRKGTSFLYGRDGVGSSFSPAKGQKLKLTVEIKSTSSQAVPASLFVTACGNKEEAIFKGLFLKGLFRMK